MLCTGTPWRAPAALMVVACFALPAQPLQYSTFFGGEFAEQANGVALDGEGNIYIVGQTRDLVAAPGSFYSVNGLTEDVFVLKTDPTLSQVLYFAVFGGGARERGSAIAVDSQGNIYTTETYEGKRLQKFVYKGMGPVTTQNQGVVWPQ